MLKPQGYSPYAALLILIFCVAYCSFAKAENWSSSDSYREASYQVLNVIDWGQTRYIANHPGQYREVESAYLIGEHPSTIDVDRMMIGSAAIHAIISYALPSEWRHAWQYITIGDKLRAVANNAAIGIKFEF